jgi:hypothetical protein
MAVSAESSSAATVELQHNGAHIESLVLLEESPQAIPLHPLGVKPLGNQYTASIVAKNHVGYFGLWPDEVLSIFLEYLDSHLLLRLSTACKFLYAFCRSDDLWKTLFIE